MGNTVNGGQVIYAKSQAVGARMYHGQGEMFVEAQAVEEGVEDGSEQTFHMCVRYCGASNGVYELWLQKCQVRQLFVVVT